VKPFAKRQFVVDERCGRRVSRATLDRSASRRTAALGLRIHSIGDGAVSLRVKLDPESAPYMHRLCNESAADEVNRFHC
jgi:hypothetical protein